MSCFRSYAIKFECTAGMGVEIAKDTTLDMESAIAQPRARICGVVLLGPLEGLPGVSPSFDASGPL